MTHRFVGIGVLAAVGTLFAPQVRAQDDYALNFDKELRLERQGGSIKRVYVASGTTGEQTFSIGATSQQKAYLNVCPKALMAQVGEAMTVRVDYDCAPQDLYLYVDLNEDGRFDVDLNDLGKPTKRSELVAYTRYQGRNSLGKEVADSVETKELPLYKLSLTLKAGCYRARLKFDRDNVDPAGPAQPDSVMVVDFLLNIHQKRHPVQVLTTNGSIVGKDYTGLPAVTEMCQELSVMALPVCSGYHHDGITVRHGHRLDGPQYVHGNRQWSEWRKGVSKMTLPADSVDGDIRICCDYTATTTVRYALDFDDEFQGEDYSQPDSSRWMRCQRQHATWNRWCSDDEAVVYIKDNQLVCRAIPNEDREADDVPMITGGIKSMGRYAFCQGKVECRARTKKHTGNFPAIWMMPQDNSAGWPNAGEIDIFETIDEQDRAWQTVHSNWHDNLGNGSPSQGGNCTTEVEEFHVYGLEWDATELRWYIDGRKVFSYAQRTDSAAVADKQWPYNAPFYLILNQSVGNGAWAKPADETFTYEMVVDWIRVYRRPEETGVEEMEIGNSGSLEIPRSRNPEPQHSSYNLAGQRVGSDYRGLVISGGRKVLRPMY